MQLFDTVALSDARMTKDGYLVTEARVARTGIQIYLGSELGLKDKGAMRIWRPADEVFKPEAMASYAHRPVTIGHPAGMVDATNWKEHSVGQTGDEVVRDGQCVKVPMVLMDKAAIDAVGGGTRELSMGYSCDVEIVDGVTPEGEQYDGIQRNLRMNHLAVVAAARGGSQLRIGDATSEDDDMGENTMKLRTVMVDGIPVEATDASAAVIEKLTKDRDAATGQIKVAQDAHAKEIAKKDAEIDDLKTKVLSDADLEKRVAARIAFVDRARLVDPKVTVDGLSEAAIRKSIVAAAVGADAAGKSDAYIEARFDILVDAAKADPVRAASIGGNPVIAVIAGSKTSDEAYRAAQLETQNAWMGNPANGKAN